MRKFFILLTFVSLFFISGCKNNENYTLKETQKTSSINTNATQQDSDKHILDTNTNNTLLEKIAKQEPKNKEENVDGPKIDDTKTLDEQLFDVILEDDLDMFKDLINKGANINAKNKVSGFYPIMLATIKGYKDIVELLIQNNADLNVRDKEDFNAFLYAIRDGHPDIAKMLLENGAGNVNDIETCWSPLHIAIDGAANNVATMKFLLENGADVNIKSCMDETPLENVSLCDTDKCREMTELLKSYGAK